MPYELLSHPADVKLRARGESLDAAFRAALDAVSAIVTDGDPVPAGERRTRQVAIEARTAEALLFDLLDRVILFQDVENAVVTGITGLSIHRSDDGFELSGTLVGAAIDPDERAMDLKAPTYSEMRVVEDDDGWVLEAVLDV
ncbi:archease [Halomicroarcula sp. GCM10025709]|uniref:archease n=1 Tax=Haloarcula TaxID=2237 RepID=UPI0024C353E6|nr:archease [Halomicroarcula sp. YJ-61-S]